mgnify:FL=1
MIEGKPDCWICRFSIAADAETARRLIRDEDHRDDEAPTRDGISIVCTDRRRVNAVPIHTPLRRCAFERDPGAEG